MKLSLNYLFLLIFTPLISGCDIHNHSHGAHVHGEAVLNLVVDDPRTLVAEFRTPSDAVIGFEYKPSSPEEIKITKESLSRFETSPDSFFRFDPALGCKAESAHAETEVTGNNHMDIQVMYTFKCEASLEGKRAVILFSEQFPEIETVRVVLVTSSRQETLILNKENHSVNF